MAFEDKEAELGLLLTRMQNEPEDWRELYELVHLKLNELKAYGMPLPQDLVQFEQDLEAEFARLPFRQCGCDRRQILGRFAIDA